MAKSRRTYSAEFKREAVQLTHEPGRTVGEVAAGLGVDRSLLQLSSDTYLYELARHVVLRIRICA